MGTIFRFKLYVAGNSPNSVQAVANLHALCREHLPERHHIEIVDVLREPKRALAEGVMITPLLVLLSPEPGCEIVGNLGDRPTVIHALGLTG